MSYRKLDKLEDSQLWQDAKEIADVVSEIYEQLPEDEKLDFKWKFKGRAYDLTSYIAEACGTFVPKDVEYDLSQARRALFGIKNGYKYLADQNSLKLDPEFMVKLDHLTDEIDKNIKEAWQNIDELEKGKQVMSIEVVPIVSESSATTLAAYENHAQTYIDGTTKEVSANGVKSWIGASLEGLSADAQILEIGSATSRDADYIESKGFRVKRTDAADSFVKFLHENGHQAERLNVLTDQIEGGNDLIFANSVLQHFTPEEVKKVLTKFHDALNDNGRSSFSITKGEGESWSERIGAPRFFHYWQPEEITALLKQTGFDSVDIKASDDPVWLNIIAHKGAKQ